MRAMFVAAVACLATVATSHPVGTGMRTDDQDTHGARAGFDRCPFYDMGTVTGCEDAPNDDTVLAKEEYYRELKALDIKELYYSIAGLMNTSQTCWPADGPQDGDKASYAGLFGRLAWHCSGSFRLVNETGQLGKAAGGCEGARQRHWPENEWRDNVNLDKARALLGAIKNKFKDKISWGDLMTFAGTVGIKASGGPAKKFCFGRVDDSNGNRSVGLGVQGINQCPAPPPPMKGQPKAKMISSDFPCFYHWRWPEQNDTDHFQCNLTQLPVNCTSGCEKRQQASHSVGLIYVYPEGPMLKNTHPEFNPKWVHNRSPKLSGLEVRDTFKNRMGWTDRETVAIIGGGHTLGRTHGNCNLAGTQWARMPYNVEGPYFEAVPNAGRGPTDGTCGNGSEAGSGPNTVSSGFDGAWTRTPSQWNYDYFDAMLTEPWEPVKSVYGNDQWWTVDRYSEYSQTRRLTADISVAEDEIYKAIAIEYSHDHEKFDSDFADAWYKLVHRSADHPHEDDLEKDAGICTNFEFLEEEIAV